MRASMAGGSDESTTAVFVPPMSTPIQTLPASFSIEGSLEIRIRRCATVAADTIEPRIRDSRCVTKDPTDVSANSAHVEAASASFLISVRVSSQLAWRALQVALCLLPGPLLEL